MRAFILSLALSFVVVLMVDTPRPATAQPSVLPLAPGHSAGQVEEVYYGYRRYRYHRHHYRPYYGYGYRRHYVGGGNPASRLKLDPRPLAVGELHPRLV